MLGIPIGGSPVDIYLLLICGIGGLMILSSRDAWKVVLIGTLILGTSLALLNQYGHGTRIFIRQGIPALFVYIGTWVLLEKTSPMLLLKAYRNVCFVAAVFGIIQFALSLRGIEILIKVPGRLDSLAYEPSHYAIAIGPMVYFASRDMLRTKNIFDIKGWTIVLSLLLTVSFTALAILVICGIMLASQKRGPIIAVGFLVAASYLYFYQELLPSVIQDRVSALNKVSVTDIDTGDMDNMSVVSPLSNWEVAIDSVVEKRRIFGNGFGGHYYAYFDYFRGFDFKFREYFGINAIAGHSLFIRSVSEFGILGFLGYIGWIFFGLSKARREDQVWWTLSAIYLFGRIIKLGGLFELGLPIFLLAPLVFYRIGKSNPRRRKMIPQLK